MKVALRLQGNDIGHALQQLPEAVAFTAQRNALIAGAELIRSAAAALAPRGDGPVHLSDSIIIDALTLSEVDRSADFVGRDAVVEVGPNLPHFYGYFLEYGTVKMGARPFMRPAFDNHASAALNITLSRLWEHIRDAAASGNGTSTTRPWTRWRAASRTVGSRNL